mgnify:CR=1 FL=1
MKKKLVELEKLIVRTPLIPFEMQNLVSKTRIYLKPENLQLFGSYKIRGVVSAIKESEPRQLLLGVAAASAGNLAQAVAFAALKLGIPCKIFIPESAPPIKKQMVRRLGAELVELPYQKVWEIVRGGIVLPHAGLFIHPALTEGLI